jgi:hypothetical protein
VNTPREFLQAIDDSRKGDSLVWDEMGVSMSARKWQSLSNILTGETLQTYRVNKLNVWFVVPDMSFIDVQARKLMTLFREVKRYNTVESQAWTYRIDVNRREGDPYFVTYRMVIDDQLVKMPIVKKPRKLLQAVPKYIWEAIREKELAFKERVRRKSLATLKEAEREDVAGQETIFDLVNKVAEDISYYKNKRGTLDLAMIQTGIGIGRGKAGQIKAFIENKRPELLK